MIMRSFATLCCRRSVDERARFGGVVDEPRAVEYNVDRTNVDDHGTFERRCGDGAPLTDVASFPQPETRTNAFAGQGARFPDRSHKHTGEF